MDETVGLDPENDAGLVGLRNRLVQLHERELAGTPDEDDEDLDLSVVTSDRASALAYAAELAFSGAAMAERSARADLLGAVVNGADDELIEPVLTALLAMVE